MNSCSNSVLFFTSTYHIYLNFNFVPVHTKNMKLKSKSTIYLLIFPYSQESSLRRWYTFAGSLKFYEQVVPPQLTLKQRYESARCGGGFPSHFALSTNNFTRTPEINEQKHWTSERYAFPNRSVKRDAT